VEAGGISAALQLQFLQNRGNSTGEEATHFPGNLRHSTIFPI
jgi:hypothetical protein